MQADVAVSCDTVPALLRWALWWCLHPGPGPLPHGSAVPVLLFGFQSWCPPGCVSSQGNCFKPQRLHYHSCCLRGLRNDCGQVTDGVFLHNTSVWFPQRHQALPQSFVWPPHFLQVYSFALCISQWFANGSAKHPRSAPELVFRYQNRSRAHLQGVFGREGSPGSAHPGSGAHSAFYS